MTATITGLPNFRGTVPTGGSAFVPTTGVPLPNGTVPPSTFVAGAIDTIDGTQVTVTGPVRLGPQAASLTDINGASISIGVITRSCTAGTGSWMGNAVIGSASVNITSGSPTGVAGSFSGTLQPGAGSGAVGTKTISGTFNATF